MNLKQKFAIIFSLLFSLILGGALLFVFSMYSDYRREEFEMRLAEKAETTVKLILEVQEIDNQLLRIIDKNTIQKLYNEKVIVFDENRQLIYSSLDDAVIEWDSRDLQYLKEHKTFFRTQDDYEVFGMYVDFQNNDYYAIVTAEDKYGKRKLIYLQYLLWTAFGIGTVSVWLISFYISKKALLSLDNVTRHIQKISDQNLNIRLPETGKKDEVEALTHSFNQMLARIDEAYEKQREFAGNASHELKTPISRMTAQLENVLRIENLDPELRATLKSITDEAFHLSDIVVSLLLLSKMNFGEASILKKVRLDELIFASVSKVKKIFHGLKFQFEIINETGSEPGLEVLGDDNLLKIAFENLIKNAYQYSSDEIVRIELEQKNNVLRMYIKNNGPVPHKHELESLFSAFFRGENSKNKSGSGLGLLIAKRILQYHNSEIYFHVLEQSLNCVEVVFQYIKEKE